MSVLMRVQTIVRPLSANNRVDPSVQCLGEERKFSRMAGDIAALQLHKGASFQMREEY